MPDQENRPIDEDEEYKSSEDEDFNPDAVDALQDDGLSSSEDELSQPTKPSKKRKKLQVDAEDELDSGDEATITELKKAKRRKSDHDEDSAGEGGLIKTRAQRKAEKQERQDFQRANLGHVTIDVDALWASMTSKPIGRLEQPTPTEDAAQLQDAPLQPQDEATHTNQDADGMITITRSYDFAGQKITEQKRVHKDSAEAKLYLSTTTNNPSNTAKAPSPPQKDDSHALRRPLRRASRFEPNPTGEVRGLPPERQRLRTPSRADVLAQQKRLEEEAKKGKSVKLNTVQKSAIDWAAHVDEQGLKDELDEYGRSKQGYIGKMDFLRGVHGKKEEEERRARLAQSSA